MSRKALAFVLAFCVVALIFLTLFVLDNTVWKDNKVQDFDTFVRETLLTENPMVENQNAYLSEENKEWLSPIGILGHTVYDFDNDGKDELLVVRSVFLKGKTNAYIYLDMYENKYGRVKLAATKAFSPYRADGDSLPSFTTSLTAELSIHLNVVNTSGKNYIVCEESSFGSAFSQGCTTNYWMLEYKNNAFSYVASFTQTAGDTVGYEFTGYDFSAGAVSGSNIYYRDYTYKDSSTLDHFGTAVSDYFARFGIMVNDYTKTSENTLYRYFNSILSPEFTVKKCCSIYNRWTLIDANTYNFEFTVD